MSSGPLHYLEAERLIRRRRLGDQNLVEAQVHATLALAAATALAHTGEMFAPDCEAWEKAASVDAASSVAAMEADDG